MNYSALLSYPVRLSYSIAMEGFSSTFNGLRLKETSSNIPPLLTKKLMPRRLPPIGLEGPKPRTQPPPPPPTPAPWSWYHRNCSQSPRSRSESPQPTQPPPKPAVRSWHHRHYKNLESLSRHNGQHNNTKKTPKPPRISMDDLWSLYEFLSGRRHLLVAYILHFLSPSEREALVRMLQHSDSTAESTPHHVRQFKKGYNEYLSEYDDKGSPLKCYLTVPSSSESSSGSGSDQSPFYRTESDEPAQITTTSELDSDYSSYKIPSVEPMIPLSRRLPVPDRQEGVILVPPMLNPGSARTSPLRRLPTPPVRHGSPPVMHGSSPVMQGSSPVRHGSPPVRHGSSPISHGSSPIYVNIDPINYGTGRSAPVHRRLPTLAYKPHKPVVASNNQINPMDSYTQSGEQLPPYNTTLKSKIGKTGHLAYPPIKMDEMVVIEMWCKNLRTQEEILLLRKLPELVSDTLKYQHMYQSLLQESQMSEFLLQVAQAIFEEMVSLDQLIKKILEVAQRLVSADRASLFLVDHRNFELVSTVFDLRYESNNDSDFSKKEIRMPINKGIAGHVAMSGETMNIPDAYSDERFNKAVDEATGYRTVSILCMPIKVRGKVIAVVQMVNKRDKAAFGNDDEAAFQVFSTFFGLALHHAKLYDKIKRKEQKYKVALEVLGYHNTCAEEDVMNLLDERNKLENINYNDFALNPFEVDDVKKCEGILTMFHDLFDIKKFDETVLARFVLTVKKNYRKVPYHNFDHGWAVANAMYVMLKHDTQNRFDYNNRLALFVACLCHDLDHRGYTNKFMSEIASPLATIYTTSTLEHHHFNMTVTILQQDGHNIFNHLSSVEYKDMLDSIRHCILATDLATFFPNLKEINELLFESTQFNWNDVNHSALVRSFSMRCADLCAAAKPFEVQLVTAEIITAEFYQQGDLERLAGRTPIPMMDRSRPEELPACQVGFLSQICLPCYTVLHELFPTTEPMLKMTKANLEIWKAKASAIEEKNKSQ